LIERSEQVQADLGNNYSCENTKLLEVIMEHLLFHWTDITDMLIDELILEEVHERNRIERLNQRDILLNEDEREESFN
jgi:hypothetical protein